MNVARLAGTLLVAAMFFATPAARAAEQPPPQQQQLRVILDWFVNPDHAPLIVAREKGFFRDAGLEVELIAPADPNDPPKLVGPSRPTSRSPTSRSSTSRSSRACPVVRVGTLVATPLNSVVVLADGPVKGVADLKGRRIGFSVGGFEDALLGRMLGRTG
jgi:putative hydroxymethylpyrimidine transport system substrate-binding protein